MMLFSINWHTDVRIAFHRLRDALLKPVRPGSRVIVISSGAAPNGSPLSGGQASAKATQRFITAYVTSTGARTTAGPAPVLGALAVPQEDAAASRSAADARVSGRARRFRAGSRRFRAAS